jgi:Ca2+-binding RTX toxin-like protein
MAMVAAVSGDGLTRTTATDRNADGRVDLLTKSVTALSDDGSITTSVEHTDDRYQVLGRSVTYVRDDGMLKETMLDLNGDGLYERRTEETSLFETDGNLYRTQITFDAAGQSIATVNSWTSGNGLQSSIWLDYTGDENFDRSTVRLEAADGSWSETLKLFGAGYRPAYASTERGSADGRTITTDIDLDGDGRRDRQVVDYTDLDGDQSTTWRDFALDGTLRTKITSLENANGMSTSYTFEIDGAGGTRFSRATVSSFDASGNRVDSFTETYGADQIAYQEVTTTAADGLSATTTFDVDGDGVTDGTHLSQTLLNADGSRQIVEQTTYADGSLRAKFSTTVSADGRTTTTADDYDGNGLADKKAQTVTAADGSRIVTERAFGQAGMPGQTFVTTTSADGLVTKILRSGVEQTITRSPVDNGSYTWNNGVAPAVGQTQIVVSHEIDALGIDTWTAVASWFVSGNSTMQTSTWQVRLDLLAKSKLLAEAARLYDTVLDRDLDVTEVEVLVTRIADGQLDKSGLAAALLGSTEFATRYGTLTNAEYITQIYLNTYGRVPSLAELDNGLRALVEGTQTRAQIAMSLSDSAEHHVAGNGHMATNNFDVIMNPAVFERSLDHAYVQSIVKGLIDVAYDRAATEYEQQYYSQLLLKGTQTPDDVAATLLANEGGIQGISSASLMGLSGGALVQQAFFNAFGRQASAQDYDTWLDNLIAGRLTAAQFLASLAQSVEHMTAGNTHIANPLISVTTFTGDAAANILTGTATADVLLGLGGADTISGGTGSDRLVGGAGADSLDGGGGNDIYEWAKGDGNDTINDTATSQNEVDRLNLTNVASTDVTLTRAMGATALAINIAGPNGTETITVANYYSGTLSGTGLEEIVFSDGVIWTRDEILALASHSGTAGSDTFGGSAARDRFLGLGGNDTLAGWLGDDLLVGGTGADSLAGGEGSDTYYWAKGDGNDTIDDASTPVTEIDRLVLTDATATEVSLSRTNGATALAIAVGSETITVLNRFSGTNTSGQGIEMIEFSDGVIWSLDDILSKAPFVGAPTSTTFMGSAYRDVFIGLAGNDTMTGYLESDVLTGGQGADSLDGGGGGDTYIWSASDGNDTINDTSSLVTEIDTLVLTNVNSADVTLTRSVGGNHLLVNVNGAGGPAVITVMNRYQSSALGYGIEAIVFADGVTWNVEDIVNRAKLSGTSAGETITGSNWRDNIYGLGGNDSLVGSSGIDLLVGGTGADTLDGGSGNDRYEWSLGDGNDLVNDTSAVNTEVDSLALLNVASTGATLSKSGTDLRITVGASGEQITVKDRFLAAASGNGVEVIAFSDGVVTRVLDSPVATATTTGTAAANTLTGWTYRDSIFGDAGNDTISGLDGDDTLTGGLGVDSLVGGNGSDQYLWARGDGNDVITDASTSTTDIDRLIFADVASTKRSGCSSPSRAAAAAGAFPRPTATMTCASSMCAGPTGISRWGRVAT